MSSKIIYKGLEEEIRKGEFSFQDSFQDIEQLEEVNTESTKLLLKLRKINHMLVQEEREKLKLDSEYKNKFRKAYLAQENSKNETQRKLLAEIQCEELEIKIIKKEQIIKELNRLVQLIKIELDTLKTIGFNIRQELH